MMQMMTRTAIHPLKIVAGVGAALLVWGLVLAYSASPAHAALDSCTTIGDTTTCTFLPSGSEDTFEVPPGVSTIHVVATGAPGAVGDDLGAGGTAGLGAQVSGDLTVTPGDTLYVNVGGTPTGGDCFPDIACVGGFNGGGSSFVGGGGGGASDVREISRAENGSLASRLIVAGGGGGSGADNRCLDRLTAGGAGGYAGTDGVAGEPCLSLTGGTGGGGGTQSAGGVAGIPDGQSGSLGQGGDGGGGFGGGGGGGYYGGGGGGDHRESDPGISAPGGGGGGSNLVPAGGNATIATTTGPSVRISYQGLVSEPPPTPGPDEDKQACKKGGYKEFGFKNQGQCIKAVNHPS
jgi:hypothetical protein